MPEPPDRGGVAGGVLLLIVIAYPRGMGMGDVKLVAIMGVYWAATSPPALLIGFLAGRWSEWH